MFNLFKKKVNFDIYKEDYIIFSLYDNQIKNFYSLVLFKDKQQFLNSLCFTYDKSNNNELLKIKKNELAMYQIGFFNAVNGKIESNVKFLGRFKDLINDFESKKLKGEQEKNDSVESKKD